MNSPVRLCPPRAGLLTLAVACLALTACGGVRQSLGLQRTAPDEFDVISRAPLSMPPDYTLRPPRPGAERPQKPDLRGRAESVVFGRNRAGGVEMRSRQIEGADRSTGELALMARAGTDKARSDIREIVNRETGVMQLEDRQLVDKLIFWKNPGPTGTVIDAAAEAERIERARAEGEDLTAGETPKITREKRAPLEGLFD